MEARAANHASYAMSSKDKKRVVPRKQEMILSSVQVSDLLY